MKRRVAEGFALLDHSESELAHLQPLHQDAASVVVRVAQWVDLGYRDVDFLRELVQKFPPDVRGRMALRAYLQLRMAEAFCAMGEEDLDRAIELLHFVLQAEDELGDQRLAAIAHFWKGRSHRKKGEYDEAMAHVVKGRSLMQAIPAPKLAAVIQIQESWLLFQKGQSAEALQLLEEARAQLAETDDALSLGNIESAKGRMERQAGKYAEASQSARPGISSRSRSASGALARHAQICREALEELQRAGEIYSLHRYYGGIASVLVSTGYLHLDSGNIELGAQEALKAYEMAHDKNDHIHMARARTLQCVTENARVDDQLGEDADAAVHANHARLYADEAVHWAELTQNRHLVAEAYVARGMMFANDFFQEWEEAKRCVDHAAALLGPEDRDHLREDLVVLKTRILRASSIDETLRAWSEGILGEKTFQQVTKEFAEIVIPKVWQREGKKVSKVSSRLSVSPKKVRRILRNVGLLDLGENG